MRFHAAITVAALGVLVGGCGVTLEIDSTELDLITTEKAYLVAEQPGNVTSSSDLVQTKWSSSDESVAIVEQSDVDPREAVVTAVGGGTATIEVKEGGEPATCTVTVTPGAPLTIGVDAGAFQLIEPYLDETRLGVEGYSAELDTYAYFLDTGEAETLLAEAGDRELTFMTPTSFVLTGTRYRLTDPIVVEDGVDQTFTFYGEDGDYEEVP